MNKTVSASMLALSLIGASLLGLGVKPANADNESYYQVTMICNDAATAGGMFYRLKGDGESENEVLQSSLDQDTDGNQDATAIGNRLTRWSVHYAFNQATSQADASNAAYMECMDLFRSYE